MADRAERAPGADPGRLEHADRLIRNRGDLGPVVRLTEQRDALLAALKEIAQLQGDGNQLASSAVIRDIARAAIQAAEA